MNLTENVVYCKYVDNPLAHMNIDFLQFNIWLEVNEGRKRKEKYSACASQLHFHNCLANLDTVHNFRFQDFMTEY